MSPKSTFIYRKVVASDAVTSIGYDPVAEQLIVAFDHGGVYQYDGVGALEAAGFETAGSKGEYFNTSIKGKYAFKRIG